MPPPTLASKRKFKFFSRAIARSSVPCDRMTYQYEVGDIVKLKKKHPCGSFEWEILRVGADFRLKCMGCGHQVMTERKMVEKNARGLTKAGNVEKA